MASMLPSRSTAVWLGLGLAGAVPTAGACFEAGAMSVTPIGIEQSKGFAASGGARARGLKLDLRLGEGGGRLTFGALTGGEGNPFLYTPPGERTAAFGTVEERADDGRRIGRLEVAHSRHLGPIDYRVGLGTATRLGSASGSPADRRRFTLSGELGYDTDDLPRLGLSVGLGHWQSGRPRLGALDMGNAWAIEGTVEIGEAIAPAGWGQALRAVLRFGASGTHGEAAPEQPRGIDLRIGIGAILRF